MRLLLLQVGPAAARLLLLQVVLLLMVQVLIFPVKSNISDCAHSGRFSVMIIFTTEKNIKR